MDAPVPLIGLALLAAGVLVAPAPRARALAMFGALTLTPILLIAHIYDSEQFRPLRDHPTLAIAGGAAALVAVAGFALLIDRRPALLPLAAVAALPFRVPIGLGNGTANLLVPLYLVIAAGSLAYLVPRLVPRSAGARAPERRAGALEWVLALVLVLYAVQAAYSDDFDHALEQLVFFYVPFALLFALLGRVQWTTRLAAACLGVLTALAVVFVGIGFVEYGTRHLLLNPKVISSNQFESYFRVNSLFFDPNIYGRFLAVVMVGIAGFLLWSRRTRDVLGAAAVLALLWAGLVLTFSQSSFAALLAGLAVLGGLRFGARPALLATGAVVAVGLAVVLFAPGAIKLDLGSSKSADAATSGRYDLIKTGVDVFGDRPLQGYGSGSFARQYRRTSDASAERATSASHTIPVTIAAEQGVIGLAAYLALLAVAFPLLWRGAGVSVPRAVIAAAFTALVVHTMLYAAFLEDPLTWALLAVGAALARPSTGPPARDA
jgi:O-antigen ligase